MIPIKKNDATIGISIKRVKKENNNEQYTLIKNIIPQNNLNVYNVSSLEKVVTKNYTIFFAISRIIFKYKTSLYYIDNEKLKILVYDNSAIDEYIENIETAVGDFYQALEKIEDYLRHQKCLSPDYTSKLECNYSKIKTDNEVEMFCMNNDYKINNFRMNRVMPYYCFFCDDDEKTNFNNRYSKFLAYMDQEKITLLIDTLFTPTDKTIGSYFVETKEKVYKKR